MLTFIILVIIAGMFKAVMDTIKFHKYSWLFGLAVKLGIKKWFASEWQPWWNPVWHWLYPSDGWHTSQTIAIILISLAFRYCVPSWWYVILFYLTFTLSFTFFFHIVFGAMSFIKIGK